MQRKRVPVESNNPFRRLSRDHLLGRLSEPDERAADERSITDGAYYEELMSEEELLIEEYAAGRLSPEDADDFRRQCSLRPDFRERLALEQALPELGVVSAAESKQAKSTGEPQRAPAIGTQIAVPSRKPRVTPSFPLIGLAASMMVVLMGSVIYLAGQLQSERHLAGKRDTEWQKRSDEQQDAISDLQRRIQGSAETGPAPQRSKDTSSPNIPQNPGIVGPLLATLLLQPTERGNDVIKELLLPPSGGWVELRLNIGTDSNFDVYRIEVKDHGSVIASSTSRPRILENYRVVSMKLPVPPSGQRSLVALVTGIASGGADMPVGSYSFALKH